MTNMEGTCGGTALSQTPFVFPASCTLRTGRCPLSSSADRSTKEKPRRRAGEQGARVPPPADRGPRARSGTPSFFFFFSTCTSCHLLQRPRPPGPGGSPQLPAGPLPPLSSVDMPTAEPRGEGRPPTPPAQVNMLTAAAQARAGSAPRVTHMSSAAGEAPTARGANPLTSHKSHLHRPPGRYDRKLRSPSPPGLPSWRRHPPLRDDERTPPATSRSHLARSPPTHAGAGMLLPGEALPHLPLHGGPPPPAHTPPTADASRRGDTGRGGGARDLSARRPWPPWCFFFFFF